MAAVLMVAPAAAQQKVLHMALQEGDANHLDPQQYQTLGEFQVLSNIFEGLTLYDPKTLQPIPGIAEKWDISSDGLKYTFHLRKGVRFHNGREVTADDVLFSFNRLADPKQATTYATGLILGSVEGFNDVSSGKATEMTGVKAIDPSTVEITLTQPDSSFLAQLTMVPAAIIPKEAVADPQKFDETPVGTGPFMVKEWVRQDHITLDANPDYWGGKPQIDEVIMRVIPLKSEALVEFQAGNLDFVVVPPSDVARLKADPSLQGRIQDQAIVSIFWLKYNLNRPPLDNLKVRQAMDFAIDRDSIVKQILQGQGAVANGPIPPGLSAYDPNYKYYTFDIDKAKSLLSEAGFPNGIDLEIRTWNDEVETRVLTAVQAMWAQAGIRATFNRTEYTAYINDMQVCKYQIGTSSWTADYAAADNLIIPIPLTDLSPEGKACGFGQVPDVKDNALKGLAAPVGPEADAFFRKAQQAAVENALGAFLYHRGATLAVGPNVDGVYFDALNAIRLFPISMK
jgi:ABC-type transport system substrate-binding protein